MAKNQQQQPTGFEYPTCTFIDIETVRGWKTFDEMPQRLQSLYHRRFLRELMQMSVPIDEAIRKHYEVNAGFTAEFGKVVCVSLGAFYTVSGQLKFMIKTIASRHEKELLQTLGISLQRAVRLCGHNIKEFDCAFLPRRYVANGMHIPAILNVMGMKTWDMPFEDTMEMWSGPQWKHKVSMDLLAELCGLGSSKTEMDGSMVADIYYSMFDGLPTTDLPFDRETEVLSKIGSYCAGDVLLNANVYCVLKEYKLISPDMIVTHGHPTIMHVSDIIKPNEKETTV